MRSPAFRQECPLPHIRGTRPWNSISAKTMKQLIERLVSGGQTGADRAALDWAIATVFRMAAGARVAAKPRTVQLITVIS